MDFKLLEIFTSFDEEETKKNDDLDAVKMVFFGANQKYTVRLPTCSSSQGKKIMWLLRMAIEREKKKA